VTSAVLASVLAGLAMILGAATQSARAADADWSRGSGDVRSGDCLGTARPQYAALNSPPTIGFTPATRERPTAPGASCFDNPDAPAAWLTVASFVTSADSPATLMERFGAISKLLPVQYWSTTEHKWRRMVSAATAIVSSDSRQPRADFSLPELLAPGDRYYSLTDTRSGRATVYRLRVRSPRATELTVDIVNVDPIKQWGITLYAPGGLHTLYLLQQRTSGTWSYYSITRLLPSSFLAEGHDKSYINRAVALYRHLVGISTNTEPPAAR
jgi:hypothetical protein